MFQLDVGYMKRADDPITEDEHFLVTRFFFWGGGMDNRYFCGRHEFFRFSVVFGVRNIACNTGCPTTYQIQQFFNNFTTDTFRHIQT